MHLKNKIIGVLMGATVLGGGITTVIKHNEGYSASAYKDSAGVWTICYGETKGVHKGLYLSTSQCNAQLVQSLAEHAEALTGLPDDLPDVVVLGAIDMTYNSGVRAFSTSKIKQHLLVKDYRAAALSVLDWRYISKKQKDKPGTGWVWMSTQGKWVFDCSQYFGSKRNTVCWGLWERRQWQAKAIGNQYTTIDAAVNALIKVRGR